MSKIIQGLYYSKDHEWLRVDGNAAFIGITDYAQDSLGDLVYADAEPVGSEISIGETLGVVESVKAASDVLSPVGLTVLEHNDEAFGDPALINQNPYDSWLVKVTLADSGELSGLMDADGYEAYVEAL